MKKKTIYYSDICVGFFFPTFSFPELASTEVNTKLFKNIWLNSYSNCYSLKHKDKCNICIEKNLFLIF